MSCAARALEWARANPARRKAICRKYYLTHKVALSAKWRRQYYATRPTYQKMCAVCGVDFSTRRSRQVYCGVKCCRRALRVRFKRTERYRAWKKSRYNKNGRESAREYRSRTNHPCAACQAPTGKQHEFCRECAYAAHTLFGPHTTRAMMSELLEQLSDPQLRRRYECLKRSKKQLNQLQQQLTETGMVSMARVLALLRETASVVQTNS